MNSIYSSRMQLSALVLVASLVLAACGSAVDSGEQIKQSSPSTSSQAQGPVPTASTSDLERTPSDSSSQESADEDVQQAINPSLINRRVEDFDAYLPPRLIGPDGIRPIYEPRFVSADDAPLNDDELVIGISIEDEAKAYPITVLRFREMVNDELGDLPILVTW